MGKPKDLRKEFTLINVESSSHLNESAKVAAVMREVRSLLRYFATRYTITLGLIIVKLYNDTIRQSKGSLEQFRCPF